MLIDFIFMKENDTVPPPPPPPPKKSMDNPALPSPELHLKIYIQIEYVKQNKNQQKIKICTGHKLLICSVYW